MYEVAETIHNFPTYAAYACAAVVGACAVGVGAFRVARECARGGRKIAAVSLVGAMLVGGMVVVGTDGAGAKPGTNDVSQVECGTNTVTQIEGGTNEWTNVEGTNTVGQTDGNDTGTNGTDVVGGPLTMGFFGRPNLAQGMGPTITGDDVERMFRVATTFDVNSFAEPMANAVTNADWRDYGGLSDSFRIRPEGWCFPYGDKTATGLTVFQNGEFRPNVKTHFFPPPFDAKLSLLPRMNWGLLPDGGESACQM